MSLTSSGEPVGVRGFESHLPHQKTNAPQLLVPSGFCLSPTLAHGDPPKVIGKSFWKPLSVRAGFRAFFSRRVRYQLVRDFLTPRNPLGTSVGINVLKIACLESRSGLI